MLIADGKRFSSKSDWNDRAAKAAAHGHVWVYASDVLMTQAKPGAMVHVSVRRQDSGIGDLQVSSHRSSFARGREALRSEEDCCNWWRQAG